jgi:hypothetical protein
VVVGIGKDHRRNACSSPEKAATTGARPSRREKGASGGWHLQLPVKSQLPASHPKEEDGFSTSRDTWRRGRRWGGDEREGEGSRAGREGVARAGIEGGARAGIEGGAREGRGPAVLGRYEDRWRLRKTRKRGVVAYALDVRVTLGCIGSNLKDLMDF